MPSVQAEGAFEELKYLEGPFLMKKRSGREQDCKVAKTVRSLLLLVCSDKIQK